MHTDTAAPAGVGHNGGPQLAPSVRTRWAKALFADKETPTYVMAMGWVIHWYADADGTGAAISNEQFEDICGMSRPTATRGKRWLLENGYVTIRAGDGRGLKSMFRMTLPVAPKGETTDHVSDPKGETSDHLPDRKGETTDPKGETPEQKGATRFPLNQEYPGSSQEGESASAGPHHRSETDEVHILAFQLGQQVKGGATAKSNRAVAKTTGELDGSGGVLFANGKLTVLNGVRAELMSEYPGIDIDEVCDRAGPDVSKISYPAVDQAKAVLRKWARIQISDRADSAARRGKAKAGGEAKIDYASIARRP